MSKGKLASALLAAGLFCLHQASSQDMLLTGAGKGAHGSGAAYTGPGDIAASAKAFWATYSCYDTAYVGNVMSVWDTATGNTTHTLVTCSTGGVITETINSLATTCATACEVETLYDQSGALACAGSTACDITMVHGGGILRPPLVLSSLNGAPCVSSGANDATLVSAANFTLAQPFTINMISERVSGVDDLYGVVRDNISAPGTIRAGYWPAADTTGFYNGSGVPVGPTATDGDYHALAYVFAHATQSVIYVDGTGTNQDLGVDTGFGSAEVALIRNGGTTAVLVCEAAIWGSDLGSTVAASLSTNSRTRYGSF